MVCLGSMVHILYPQKEEKMKKHLIPKIVTIVYILFISMFALDEPFFTLGFLMHLLPSLVLVIILAISWKYERFGTVSFLVLGIVFTIFFNTYRELISFLIITLPLLIIAILFWIFKKK